MEAKIFIKNKTENLIDKLKKLHKKQLKCYNNKEQHNGNYVVRDKYPKTPTKQD